jgi:outer membrane protein assembly factor BamB
MKWSILGLVVAWTGSMVMAGAPDDAVGPKGPEVVEKWTYRLDNNADAGSNLALHDGLLYVVRRGVLFCVDPMTGQEKSKRHGKEGDVLGAPIIVDGVLYLAHRKYFAAEDPASGKELWRYTPAADGADTEIAKPGKYYNVVQPLVTEDLVVFIPATAWNDEKPPAMYALNRKTGELAWTYANPNKTGLSTPPAFAFGCVLVGAYPSIGEGEKIHFRTRGGNGDAKLMALDPKTGKPSWEVQTGKAIFCNLAANEQRKEVYAAGIANSLYVIDAEGKTLKQTIEFVSGGGKSQFTTASAGLRQFKNLCLIGGFEHPVVAIDVEAGKLAWTFKPDVERWAAMQYVTVAGDVVYTSDMVHGPGTRTFGLDAATGKVLWSCNVTSMGTGVWPQYRFLTSNPVAYNGLMIYADTAGVLRALGDKQ